MRVTLKCHPYTKELNTISKPKIIQGFQKKKQLLSSLGLCIYLTVGKGRFQKEFPDSLLGASRALSCLAYKWSFSEAKSKIGVTNRNDLSSVHGYYNH